MQTWRRQIKGRFRRFSPLKFSVYSIANTSIRIRFLNNTVGCSNVCFPAKRVFNFERKKAWKKKRKWMKVIIELVLLPVTSYYFCDLWEWQNWLRFNFDGALAPHDTFLSLPFSLRWKNRSISIFFFISLSHYAIWENCIISDRCNETFVRPFQILIKCSARRAVDWRVQVCILTILFIHRFTREICA